MKRRRQTRDPILLEVAAAIGAGRITIASIQMGDDEHVHGVTWPDGGIVINPMVEIVDTVLHECLHRMRPTWSEQTVKARTTRLMRGLSHAEVECLYTLVLSSATVKGKRRQRAALR